MKALAIIINGHHTREQKMHLDLDKNFIENKPGKQPRYGLGSHDHLCKRTLNLVQTFTEPHYMVFIDGKANESMNPQTLNVEDRKFYNQINYHVEPAFYEGFKGTKRDLLMIGLGVLGGMGLLAIIRLALQATGRIPAF